MHLLSHTTNEAMTARREMISRTKPYAGMNVQMHRAQVCENGERPPLDARVFREVGCTLPSTPVYEQASFFA